MGSPWAKTEASAGLPGGSGERSVSCLFQLCGTTCVLWLMSLPSSSKPATAGAVLTLHLSLLLWSHPPCWPRPSSASLFCWDYPGSTWMIQDNLPILQSENFILIPLAILILCTMQDIDILGSTVILWATNAVLFPFSSQYSLKPRRILNVSYLFFLLWICWKQKLQS